MPPMHQVELLALPGFDGTARLFDDFAQALPDWLDFRAVPYPNLGRLGYAELERIALVALPDDRPFFLLGESFSGPIALRLAARKPRNLRGVILCASFARSPWYRLRAFSPLARRLPIKSVTASALSHFLLGRWSTPQRVASVRGALAHVSTDAIGARMDAVLHVDVSSELRALRLPLFYLRGRHDRLLPVRAYQQLRKCNPDIQFHDMDGPHLLLQARPEECARIVSAYAARHSDLRTSPHRSSST